MEILDQPKLRFTGVDILNVNFESIRRYTKSDSESTPINTSITPEAFLPKDQPDHFKIVMFVELIAEGYFSLQLTAIGHFVLKGENLSDEMKRSFINANSTAIVYPYIRSFVSTFTSNIGSNFDRILLGTKFFKGDIRIVNELEMDDSQLGSDGL